MKPKSQNDFFTYPRQFTGYRWFKPLLVMLLCGFFTIILACVVMIVSSVVSYAEGGDPRALLSMTSSRYDSFNAYSASGAILYLGNVATIIPALALASRIVKDRPFSSYSSSLGGFRLKTFGKSFLVALICVALPIFIVSFSTESRGDLQFTVVGFILCTILGPLQCIAEEYFFRALCPQTIGSWIPIPVVSMLLSTLVFMMAHPYNGIGKLEVFVSGFCMCLLAWIGNGIEASSAFHIANNMTIFYMTGFGIGKVQTNSDIKDLIPSIAIDILFVVIMYFIQKKYHWFDEAKEAGIK